jgi:DNA repair protein RadC
VISPARHLTEPRGSVAQDLSPRRGPGWTTGPAQGDGEVAARPGCAVCDVRAFHPAEPGERVEITSPEAAAQLLLPRFRGADRERCMAALLDTKHRLLELAVVSIGSIDHTFMSPREVFRDALMSNAAALVVAHNHPSGDPDPSRDDELVTRRLVKAGQVIGVELLDHLVIGGSRWVSLARRGVLG